MFHDGVVDTIDDGVDTVTDYTTDPVGDALGNPVQDAGDAVDDATDAAGDAAEGWLASGWSRDAYDWVMDYDEEWQGEGDRHDLIGPSLDFGNLFDASSEGDVFQWNNPDGAENDPTNPDNWPVPVSVVKWVLIAAVLAYVFGQAFDIQLG